MKLLPVLVALQEMGDKYCNHVMAGPQGILLFEGMGTTLVPKRKKQHNTPCDLSFTDLKT
jgi:hypothetical protein